jgi:hypothetical protein
MKKIMDVKLSVLLLALLVSFNISAAQIKVLEWEDLIPPAEKLILDAWQNSANNNAEFILEPPQNIGKVRPELDGKHVKIAGFVIPLEGDEETISEMLLVPYFGACFHVPPPPSNQIIHITFKTAIKIKELWDVVYVEGELKTKTIINELAEVGYVMEGYSVEPYEE